MEFYSVLNSKKAENVNASLTFEGLRNKFIEAGKKIDVVKRANAAELKEIRSSEIYHEKYIQNKESEFKNKENAVISECVAEVKEAAKKVVATKKEAIGKMITTPPTQEQMNLLQSLQMQGKGLSATEINAIFPELASNYRALKTLQTIAQSVGFSVSLPAQYDYEELSRNLARAEAYLAERISDLAKPVSEWGIASDCFFGPVKYNLSAEEWEKQRWNDPHYSAFSEILDGNVQTAPVVAPVKELTDKEKNILNDLFSNKAGEDLKAAVNDAATIPGVADLISRSEYAQHLEKAGTEV